MFSYRFRLSLLVRKGPSHLALRNSHYALSRRGRVCSAALRAHSYVVCSVCRLVAECFCGNYFKKKDKVDTGDCDYACSGKPSAACGGRSRINMYKFDGHSYADEEELAKPESGNMLGCFKDTKNNRVLNLKGEYKLEDMTPEVR